MKSNLEKSLLMGIGLLSMTHEKAQKIVEDLSKRGELERDEQRNGSADSAAAVRKNARRFARSSVTS